MSCTARIVPARVPVTFERPIRGRYWTGRSSMRHPAARGAQHHLERPTGAPVLDAELEQVDAVEPRASARDR